MTGVKTNELKFLCEGCEEELIHFTEYEDKGLCLAVYCLRCQRWQVNYFAAGKCASTLLKGDSP